MYLDDYVRDTATQGLDPSFLEETSQDDKIDLRDKASVLTGPGSALTGMVFDALERVGDVVQNPLKRLLKQDYGEIVPSMGRAVMGEEETSEPELFKAFEENPVTKYPTKLAYGTTELSMPGQGASALADMVRGKRTAQDVVAKGREKATGLVGQFALGAATDPTMYLPYTGWANKIKGVKQAIRGSGPGKFVGRLMEKEPGLFNLIDELGPEVEDLRDMYRGNLKAIAHSTKQTGKELQKMFPESIREKAAFAFDLTPEQEVTRIRGTFTPEQNATFDEIGKFFADTETDLVSRGLLAPESAKIAKGEKYLPHYLQQGTEFDPERSMAFGDTILSKKAGSLKQRTREGSLAEKAAQYPGEYETDITKIYQRHSLDTGAQLARDSYMNNLVEKFGEPLVEGKAKEGWKSLKDLRISIPGVKKFENAQVPEVLAKYIERTYTPKYMNESMEQAKDLWKAGTSYWKGLALTDIDYHTYNIAGSLWNDILDDRNTQAYHLAKKVLQNYDNPVELAKIKVRGITGNQIAKALQANDLGQGMFSEAMPSLSRTDFAMNFAGKTAMGKVGEAAKPITSPLKTALAANRKLQQPVEDFVRSAAFIDHWLLRGEDMLAAARATKKVHYDYDQLGKVDKAIKEVIPFWVWTKNNVPRQVSMLIEKPWKAANLGRGIRTWEQNNPTDMTMTKTARKGVKVPVADVGSGTVTANLRAAIPFFDINALYPSETIPTLLGMAQPAVKEPIQLGTGRDIQSGKPIPSYPGQNTRLYGMDAPWLANRLNNLFRPAATASRFINKEGIPTLKNLMQGKGIDMKGGGLTALSQLLPGNVEYHPKMGQTRVGQAEFEFMHREYKRMLDKYQDLNQKIQSGKGTENLLQELSRLQRSIRSVEGMLKYYYGTPTLEELDINK